MRSAREIDGGAVSIVGKPRRKGARFKLSWEKQLVRVERLSWTVQGTFKGGQRARILLTAVRTADVTAFVWARWVGKAAGS